jgi:DNA-binding response OmpR family regulator
MKRVLYIDDDELHLRKFEEHVREKYPNIEPVTATDPVHALALIDTSLDLLMVDLEMPKMDGKKILNYAIEKGLDRRKIIIFSARDAEYLHDVIPMGECLCVLNKTETRQRHVLEMVLQSISRK